MNIQFPLHSSRNTEIAYIWEICWCQIRLKPASWTCRFRDVSRVASILQMNGIVFGPAKETLLWRSTIRSHNDGPHMDLCLRLFPCKLAFVVFVCEILHFHRKKLLAIFESGVRAPMTLASKQNIKIFWPQRCRKTENGSKNEKIASVDFNWQEKLLCWHVWIWHQMAHSH